MWAWSAEALTITVHLENSIPIPA